VAAIAVQAQEATRDGRRETSFGVEGRHRIREPDDGMPEEEPSSRQEHGAGSNDSVAGHDRAFDDQRFTRQPTRRTSVLTLTLGSRF
jgi:hypothetical protein